MRSALFTTMLLVTLGAACDSSEGNEPSGPVGSASGKADDVAGTDTQTSGIGGTTDDADSWGTSGSSGGSSSGGSGSSSSGSGTGAGTSSGTTGDWGTSSGTGSSSGTSG